ncbi:hypothetical protein ACEQ8H_006337 [Pleosporales sp. CAS-2024a]
MVNNDTTSSSHDTESMSTQAVECDLVNSMRRLSVGSAASSISLISDAPSVLSLDTNGSVNGGVPVLPSLEVLETYLEALTAANSKLEALILPDEADLTTALAPPTTTADSKAEEATIDASPSEEPSPYWLQFSRFEPSPRAPFKKELARLAKHENWSNKEKRKQQVKALAAEITHHYGTNRNKLDRWQQLCEDVGVDIVPKSITQCRKVISPVLVNLYNVIDHRRNPEVKIVRFKSYRDFVRYTRAGHTFPKECAKQDNFISVFLRKM